MLVLIALTAVCSLSKLSSASLSPILLIPGDGGNQLEAKLSKTADTTPTGCPLSSSWYRLWLDVWQLRKGKLECWADNIRLEYNRSTKKSRNRAGVQTRVPGWGHTDSMEYLDPSWSAWVLADAGNYLHDMVEFLVDQGYTRGRSVRGAPYDFRLAPHSQLEYFSRMVSLIEEMYSDNDNTPVTIISHSMGGLFGLHFLQGRSKSWLSKYIHKFIPLNTPWRGAALQLNTYASGYNMDISLIDPLVIRHEQRSYETGVYILPLPTTWHDQQQVLVHTPRRNYTVQNYQEFFNDIGFPIGWEMMNNILRLTPLTHPGVPTSCVYSVGVPTPVQFVYNEGFPDTQPTRLMGDGDGTVSKESAEACRTFLTKDEDSIMVFRGPNHGDILKNIDVFTFIMSQVKIS